MQQQNPLRPCTRTTEFTGEMLQMICDSFPAMDETFERQRRHPHKLLPFALATYGGIKQKVMEMLASPGTFKPFDNNEVILVRACLQIHRIDLLRLTATPENRRLLDVCDEAIRMLSMPAGFQA